MVLKTEGLVKLLKFGQWISSVGGQKGGGLLGPNGAGKPPPFT